MKRSDLSPDQVEAYNGITTWLNRGTLTKPTLTFAGYAGTGKTTVIAVLAKELPRPLAFAAFSGKASSVLRRNLRTHGVETTAKPDNDDEAMIQDPRPYCGTIHGLIYRPCPECCPEEISYEHTQTGNCRAVKNDNCEEHEMPRGRCTDCGSCLACDPPQAKPRKTGPCHMCEGFRFVRRTELDRPYRLIVLDEASMVSDEMLDDLRTFNVPILAVGDHGQLKPVRGEGSLMRSPDIRLEKIHRQAESNPIIALSKYVREVGGIHPKFADGKHVSFQDQIKIADLMGRNFQPSKDDLLSIVFITATNKRRAALNRGARASLGRDGLPPCKGDVVICLKNRPPVYNGMRGIITGDVVHEDDEKRPKYLTTVDFPEDGTMDKDVEMSALQFGLEKTIESDWAYEHEVAPVASLGALYDYGYAITCHKMQGSQADRVAVIYERGLERWMGADGERRWLYTSVTRSSNKLIIFR